MVQGAVDRLFRVGLKSLDWEMARRWRTLDVSLFLSFRLLQSGQKRCFQSITKVKSKYQALIQTMHNAWCREQCDGQIAIMISNSTMPAALS